MTNDFGNGPEISRGDLLRARLFDRRVVMINGVLDDEAAATAAAELMTLDAAGDERVELLLNSGSGSLEAAFTVMDVIDLLGVPVHATCVGRAEGAAVGVLAVAAQRFAVQHARFRLCAPERAFSGRADDVVTWAEPQEDQLHRVTARLAGAMRRARWR